MTHPFDRLRTGFNRQELLARAAENASKRSEFLGYLFSLYSRAHSLNRTEMAKELDCSEEKVIQMSLCLRPGRGARNFSEDVDRISSRFSVDSHRLITVVRSAEALEAFQGVASHGLLMAAREWEQDTENKEGNSQDRNSG